MKILMIDYIPPVINFLLNKEINKGKEIINGDNKLGGGVSYTC